uniref:GST C-terminal domain-containing protein n=1 Tax=Glossina palpalis gambiensis TaxID=67801 RepID=A0A1B0BMZ8_9MUSC
MDDSEVQMVRSAKGKDMLLVGKYLFHYDDRTTKAYRWVCSRRKDAIPCRVRLYTTLIDETDETQHAVIRITGEHPHGPADEDAIKKAKERKRSAVMLGLACTLPNNTLKRKLKAEQAKLAKLARLAATGNENESELVESLLEECETDISTSMMGQEEEKKVLMLKTAKGYNMIAVNGCVYRLGGKSVMSSTYRWKCFRSKDLQCTARIYTECLTSGQHRYKAIRLNEGVHNHEPYTENKVTTLIRRNNIKILHGDEEHGTLQVFDGFKCNPLKVGMAPLSSQSGGKVQGICGSLGTPVRQGVRYERAESTAALYKYVENPIEALNDPKDGEITKFTFLPSKKGNKVLCLNKMIYHYDSKGATSNRAYWTCLYRRHKGHKCNGRLTTEDVEGLTRITKVSGMHNHEDHMSYIEKKLSESVRSAVSQPDSLRDDDDNDSFTQHVIEEEDSDGRTDGDITYHEMVQIDPNDTEYDNKSFDSKIEIVYEDTVVEEILGGFDENENEHKFYETVDCKIEKDSLKDTIEYVEMERATEDEIKNYHFKYECDDYDNDDEEVNDDLVSIDDNHDSDETYTPNVNFMASEHMTDEYAKLNPQKEIPVVDDHGFCLSGSVATTQYLCDEYADKTPLYPKTPKVRALVNHRLCFNTSCYYASISPYTMAPIFFDYERTELGLKKVRNALSVFETYVRRLGAKYAADNHLTIADFALSSSTLCLEAIEFDLKSYPLVWKWYQTFKREYPTLWDIGNTGMKEIIHFEQNPPDMSHMQPSIPSYKESFYILTCLCFNENKSFLSFFFM